MPLETRPSFQRRFVQPIAIFKACLGSIALLMANSCNVQNPVIEKKDVTPVFSPEGGKYSTSQSVSITISDSKSLIAYSTDGSDPRSAIFPLQSDLGTASVSVDRSGILRAAVRFEDGSYGPLVEAEYSILDTPVVALPGGNHIGAQTVSLSCATPGASIHYTLDGSAPTRSSIQYTVPLFVDSSLTLRAVSWKDGWGTSPVVSTRYSLQARAPVASVPAGAYRSSQSITLSASSGATIRCTKDGSVPSTSSSVCSGSIRIDSDMVVRAIATLPGQSPSFETYLDYAILHPPEIQPSTGFYESPQSLRITTNSKDATIHYTLDGSLPTASSPTFASPVKIQSPSKVQAIVLRNGVASQATVADLKVVVPPAFDPPAGRYAGSVQVAMSTPTSQASIRYTNDSTNPDRSSKTYSSPLTITSNTTFRAASEIGDALGRTEQAIYVIVPESTVARPSIGPAGGSYIGRQQVYMSCATTGAQIRYTLDGRFPTRNDSLYTAPLSISYTTTVKAVAILDSVSSLPATANYTISQLRAPSFSPSGGTYRGNQAVFIETGTSGATVRCTKDGSYPTISSPSCNSAITVFAGTTTIRAISTYGDQASSVSSATYEITSTTGGGGTGGGTGSCSYCSYTLSTMESRIASDQRLIDQLVSTNAKTSAIQAARDQLAADQRLKATLIQCGCQ